MTKHVRIENADTSTYPVRVTIQHMKYGEDGQPTGEWVDVESKQIDYPTAMVQEYLTSARRIIIEERAKDA